MRAPHLPRRAAEAFTLLEVLVSVTILAVLLLILMSMVDGATRLWRQSENSVDSYREARAALNVIAADLASIHVSSNTNFFKLVGDKELRFLSAVRKDYQEVAESRSDLCEIGYTLSYERPEGPQSKAGIPESYNLYRTFNNSDPTFSNLRTNQLFRPDSGSRELLARNVADVQILAYTVDDNGIPTQWLKPSDDNPMPEVIEITLKAINNDTAQKFKSKSDWSNENSALYKANIRKFTTRVHLSREALAPSPTPSP